MEEGGREREARERDEGRYALPYDANSPPLSLPFFSLPLLTPDSQKRGHNKQTNEQHTAWVVLSAIFFLALLLFIPLLHNPPYLSEFRSSTQ